MSIEIVHDEDHLFSVPIPLFKHFPDEVCPVNLGPTLGNFYISLPSERFNLHKYVGNSIANIFVVHKNRMTWRCRNRLLHFPDQLHARFVHTHHRKSGIIRARINFKNIFHRCYKACVLVRRDFPILALVRFKFIFFKVLHTVIGETLGTIFSSTIFSAKSRTVHRLLPSGACEQAKAKSFASKSPPNWISRGGVCRSLRSMAAERPCSTNRFFKCSRLREVIPRASATLSTNHLGPYSPASSNSNAREYNTVRAALLPLVDMASNSCRSSLVKVTLYRGAMSSSLYGIYERQ